MFKLILGLVISAAAGAAVTAGVRLIRRMVGSEDRLVWAPYATVAGAALLALLGLGLLAGTSFTIIDAEEVGHLQRVYGGSSMPPMPPRMLVVLAQLEPKSPLSTCASCASRGGCPR